MICMSHARLVSKEFIVIWRPVKLCESFDATSSLWGRAISAVVKVDILVNVHACLFSVRGCVCAYCFWQLSTCRITWSQYRTRKCQFRQTLKGKKWSYLATFIRFMTGTKSKQANWNELTLVIVIAMWLMRFCSAAW